MSRKYNSNKVFLQVIFCSPEREAKLKTIELCGIPAFRASSGQYVADIQVQKIFDTLLVRNLFRNSIRYPEHYFDHLKIWLYDISTTGNNQGYEIPVINDKDLVLHSNISTSILKRIYILDNDLSAQDHEARKKMAEFFFNPLFSKFRPASPLPKPQLTNVTKNTSFMKNIMEGFTDVSEKGELNLKIKETLLSHFNALIISTRLAIK
jgi:hypothetical protein